MEAKRQARMFASDLSQADNIYAAEAAELDTDVKNRATKLLAYPLGPGGGAGGAAPRIGLCHRVLEVMAHAGWSR